MANGNSKTYLVLAAVAAMVAVTLVRSPRGRSLLAVGVRALVAARKANAGAGAEPLPPA